MMLRFLFSLVCAVLPMAASAQQAVILVRHAELAGGSSASAQGASLSRAGQERARRLASMFGDAGLAAVYVADAPAAKQTALPIAKRMGRTPVVMPAGADALVQQLRSAHAGQRVMVIADADGVADALSALGHAKHIRIPGPDYGNVFLVTPHEDGAPSVVRMRMGG